MNLKYQQCVPGNSGMIYQKVNRGAFNNNRNGEVIKICLNPLESGQCFQLQVVFLLRVRLLANQNPCMSLKKPSG